MASLTTIRSTIKSTLGTALGAGTQVYEEVPGSPALPCVYIVPVSTDFDVAMGRGTDTWRLNLIVLVPSADNIVGQKLLDPYVSGAGSSSIRQAIWNARSTLQAAGIDAHVSAMTAYGGRYEGVGKDHIGATLTLVVHTSGTE